MKTSGYKHHCLRCGYKWRSWLEEPVQCPSCKNPYWNVCYVRSDKVGKEK